MNTVLAVCRSLSVFFLITLSLTAHLALAGEPPSERPSLDEVLSVYADRDYEPKAYWQERYTKLLQQRFIEDRVIERERELYADANRRNYRRGKKRHQHRDAMLEAIARKGEVEDRLAVFKEEARRAGALPGWLYEVEDSWRESLVSPPAATGDGADANSEDEGRNPRFSEKNQ